MASHPSPEIKRRVLARPSELTPPSGEGCPPWLALNVRASHALDRARRQRGCVRSRSEVILVTSLPNRIGRSTRPLTSNGGAARSIARYPPIATSWFPLPRSFVRITHLYLPGLRLFLMNLRTDRKSVV